MIRLTALLVLVLVCCISVVCSALAVRSRDSKKNIHPLFQKIHKLFHPRKDLPTDPYSIFAAQNFSGIARFDWPQTMSWSHNFGYLDTRFKIPFPANNQEPTYPIASNTKLYIALSLYQLVEAGAIKSIDDNIADYLSPQDFVAMGLPGVQKYCPTVQGESKSNSNSNSNSNSSSSSSSSPSCQRVTFADLLGMSSGIQNQGMQWLPFPGSLALVCGWHIMKPLLFIPGSPSSQYPQFREYYYSNAGFECAAYFVEKLSGMRLNDYLTKNIFSVAGLENTYFDPFNGKFKLNPTRVNEYYQFFEAANRSNLLGLGQVSSEYDLGSAGGAGGILSTPGDERKLYRFLFSNFSASFAPPGGRRIVSQENLLRIVTPRSFIQENFFYGQGIALIAPQNTSWSQRTTDRRTSGRIPNTNPPVTQIIYEGEIMGSRTSNVFDLRYEPPVMAQVWSSNIAFYPTKEEYESVFSSRNQDFWQLTANWAQQEPLQQMSMDLIQVLAGNPPATF